MNKDVHYHVKPALRRELIDFVINRYYMKLFKTSNIRIVQLCQELLHFDLPSVQLARRRKVFLPRDAMHKRGLYRHAVSVCLSVCLLSVTFVDHVKTNKCIFEFFLLSGSHNILVIPHGMAIFRREPPKRGRRMQVG